MELRSVNAVTPSVVETLRIKEAGSDRFGNYSCSANNSISSSSSRLVFSGQVYVVPDILSEKKSLCCVNVQLIPRICQIEEKINKSSQEICGKEMHFLFSFWPELS